MWQARNSRADLIGRDAMFSHPVAGQVVQFLGIAASEVFCVVGGIFRRVLGHVYSLAPARATCNESLPSGRRHARSDTVASAWCTVLAERAVCLISLGAGQTSTIEYRIIRRIGFAKCLNTTSMNLFLFIRNPIASPRRILVSRNRFSFDSDIGVAKEGRKSSGLTKSK